MCPFQMAPCPFVNLGRTLLMCRTLNPTVVNSRPTHGLVETSTIVILLLPLLILDFLLFDSLRPIQDNVVLAYKDSYLPLDDVLLTLDSGDEIAVIPPLSGG